MFEIIKIETQNGVNALSDYVLDIVENIPFGNSDFQNKMTIVNGELSPHRALRHSSLRIMNRVNALNECYYSIKENDIKIEKLNREIQRLETAKSEDYDLEIGLKQIEIDKMISTVNYTAKLIKDAIQEIQSLMPVLESSGKITREKFESMEEGHFVKLLSEGKNGFDAISSNLYNEIVENKVLLLPVSGG